MQKLSKEKYQFNRHRQKIILNQRKRRKNRKSKEIRGLFNSKESILYKKLIAPSVFCIHAAEARSNLISFLHEFRITIVKKRKPVLIDFSSTKKMISGGTLLFVAELERVMKLTSKSVVIRCIPPRNNKVLQVLEQIGVLSYLKCRKHITPVDRDVVNWRYAKGNQVLGEKYDDILEDYDGRLTEAIATGFYNGLTEAMTNSRQHAYIDSRKDGLNISDESTDWWMFSQENNGTLFVVFCDLGIGIPRTLPMKKPGLWDQLKTLSRTVSDGAAISAAINDSITRTGKSYRGKGLRQLLDVVMNSNNGIISVYSNSGHYLYKDGKHSHSNFKDSICGTVIAWQIPLTHSESNQYANN
jgi:hypothetical protein